MAEPVLERDLQDLKDLEASSEGGNEESARALFFRLQALVKSPTKWQWVIHGDSVVYRQRCVRWLLREGRYTQARRFAMCGRGDQALVADEGNGVRIQPRGCGARFCPRCSRRYGRRFLRRVEAHLEAEPHGELWHVVLTQRVKPEETLEAARDRFGRAWRRFYAYLRGAGMRSGLATYHVTASSVKGWHYHCHLLLEWEPGIEGERKYGGLDEAWWVAQRDSSSKRKALFARRVSGEGEAMKGLGGEGQMDFWAESQDAVEVCLQYVLRDVLQGVEGWIEKLVSDEQCVAFAAALHSAKLHRLYGGWRRKMEAEEEDQEGSETVAASVDKRMSGTQPSIVIWKRVGSMDEVLFWARQGRVDGMDVVSRLLNRTSNRGRVASRLCQLARDIAVSRVQG